MTRQKFYARDLRELLGDREKILGTANIKTERREVFDCLFLLMRGAAGVEMWARFFFVCVTILHANAYTPINLVSLYRNGCRAWAGLSCLACPCFLRP